MNLSLQVLQGSAEGREIPIRLSQFLIGRDPECQLRPASPLVSKRHCAIFVRADRVYLRDFDSTNGTLVNRQPIKGETELKDGDELKIGPLFFRVKVRADSDVDGQAAETPQAGRKAADAAAPPRPGKSDFDEDSLMDVLLSEGDIPPGAGGDPIPSGSTIMEGINVETAPPDNAEKEKEDPKKAGKPKIDPASTANAAKAILDKYMRRPRT
jgi:predicted component of type VI protein secretion system